MAFRRKVEIVISKGLNIDGNKIFFFFCFRSSSYQFAIWKSDKIAKLRSHSLIVCYLTSAKTKC